MQSARPLVIGLTGGIGSGKSTAADCFSRLGVPVIDTDTIARELVAPGQPALDEILAVFGQDCLSANGDLDRAWLRNKVFTDSALRQRLEAILHPKIIHKISSLLDNIRAAYCVVVIPLLLEAGLTGLVDRILVIDTPEEQQMARVSARNGLRRDEITAIMHSQASRAERLAAADDVIANDSTLKAVQDRVRSLHEHYLEISRKRQV